MYISSKMILTFISPPTPQKANLIMIFAITTTLYSSQYFQLSMLN